MKHINKRQNPLTHIPENFLDNLFDLLIQKYSENWLNKSDNHPLQILWKRKDWLSTTELFLLAASICNLERIDSKWVDEQIENSKQTNQNTHKGAFFELISLESILNSKLSVKPAVKNQPGYDGIVKLRNGSEIILSIKNYNLSKSHKTFIERSEKFEIYFINLLKQLKICNIQATIDIATNYPNEEDWQKLEKGIETLLLKYDGSLTFSRINDSWAIFLKEMTDDKQTFDDKYFNSYTLMIHSTYHKNEHNNIYSKLESACHNLIKANIKESDKSLNCLLIHVPISVSIDNCIKWTKDYYKDYPDDPISCVFYYQPAVVSDFEENSSRIHHCLALAPRERYFDFGEKNGVATFRFPVGTHGYEPTVLKFTNEKGETLPITERYIFQSGSHYYKMIENKPDQFSGFMMNQGYGIYNHLIWETGKKLLNLKVLFLRHMTY